MKVVLATGGSGGHILPALQVGEALKKRGHQVSVMGHLGATGLDARLKAFETVQVPSRGLGFWPLSRLWRCVVAMIRALWQSLRILAQSRPDVVVGFGGYGAFPVVMAASLTRRPTIIHEQNVLPGKANKLLSWGVKKVAISFLASQVYFARARTVLTGCPSHEPGSIGDRAEMLRYFGLVDRTATLLVMGGSQGSQVINATLLEAIPLVMARQEIQVIHLTGREAVTPIQECYASWGVRAWVAPFLACMAWAYALADVAVARAGAVTVSELALFQLRSVLVPYPYAQGHQQANARLLVEAGGAVLIEQDQLNAEVLATAVRTSLGAVAGTFKTVAQPNATQNLVQLIERFSP